MSLDSKNDFSMRAPRSKRLNKERTPYGASPKKTSVKTTPNISTYFINQLSYIIFSAYSAQNEDVEIQQDAEIQQDTETQQDAAHDFGYIPDKLLDFLIQPLNLTMNILNYEETQSSSSSPLQQTPNQFFLNQNDDVIDEIMSMFHTQVQQVQQVQSTTQEILRPEKIVYDNVNNLHKYARSLTFFAQQMNIMLSVFKENHERCQCIICGRHTTTYALARNYDDNTHNIVIGMCCLNEIKTAWKNGLGQFFLVINTTYLGTNERICDLCKKRNNCYTISEKYAIDQNKNHDVYDFFFCVACVGNRL